MAVSYVGATSGSSGGATSTSFATSLPSGWAADDVAVLAAHVSGGVLTISTPAGWTLVPGVSWPVAEGSASRMYVWYRVLQGGDSAPTLTNSGSVTGGWEMQAFRGGSTSTPVGDADTFTAAATSIGLPTLTGVLDGSMLAVSVHARVASGTIPTGIDPDGAYTETVDQATSRGTGSANVRAEAAYRAISSAGSFGGESFAVANGVTSSMVAALVEVVAGVTQVSASTATGWHVAAETSKAVVTGWQVAATVTATTATGWNAAATVTAASSTGWNTAAAVAQNTNTGWVTAGRVDATTATGWNTRTETAAAVASGWSVAASTTADTATGWNVASAPAADITTGWQVASTIQADTASTWAVHAPTETATTTGWVTASVVAAPTSTGWAVGVAVAAPARGTLTLPAVSTLTAPSGSTLTIRARSEVTVR